MQIQTWQGCYDDGWGDFIVPEAFAHPAKFSRGLIERIIHHGLDKGYWKPGELIGDPFGGVALGGLIATYNGLGWFGVELEQKFMDLGQRNIDLHRRKLDALGAPIPVIVHGDSREFAKHMQAAGIVTSPPYAESLNQGGAVGHSAKRARAGRKQAETHYGTTPGQIGALKAGDLGAVITSPPYADQPGSPSLGSVNKDDWGGEGTDIVARRGLAAGYGETPGNIGNLRLGAVVTSPPYAEAKTHPSLGHPELADGGKGDYLKHATTDTEPGSEKYGDTPGNIGNECGETYWQAVAQVYHQCWLALKPGGYMVVVVKNYVKDKKIVPLCDQTWELLQHIGFQPIERIRAMLVKERKHKGLFGNIIDRTERKSFFRRLAESKGSPRIDWEEVLWLRKET